MIFLPPLARDGSTKNGNGARFHFLCAVCRWSVSPLGTCLILTNVLWVAVLISFTAHYSRAHIAHTLPVNGTALGVQEQSLHMMRECVNKSNFSLNLLAYAENGTFT